MASILVFLAATPCGVRAQGWALDVAGGTSLPVDIGASLTAELPARVLLDFRIGYMPNAYIGLINDLAESFDWYDEVTARIIEAAVDDSLVLRFGGGFRPVGGLEIMGGYTLVTAGGGITVDDLLQTATGRRFNSARTEDVPIEATLHAVHVSVGARFVFLERLVLRFAFEWTHTFASDFRIDYPRNASAAGAAEAYLEDLMRRYGFTPATNRLQLGYRFGG